MRSARNGRARYEAILKGSMLDALNTCKTITCCFGGHPFNITRKRDRTVLQSWTMDFLSWTYQADTPLMAS